jgi:hypothetical protein
LRPLKGSAEWNHIKTLELTEVIWPLEAVEDIIVPFLSSSDLLEL